MDKKIIQIMMVLSIMFLAVCVSPKQVMAADGTLKVQIYNTGTSSVTNSISPNFEVVNTGSTAINLSEVTLRYYYTKDGSQEQSFWCDGAFISGAQDCTSKVTGRFVDMNTPDSNADNYLEIGFTSDAGTLNSGENVDIHTRFAKSDWSNYNQANDYSFNSSATFYVDSTKVTAYIGGTKVWGGEPIPLLPPTGLSATAGDGQISLSWNNAAGADSYKVYESQTSGIYDANPTETVTTGTSITIGGLNNGNTYYFVVKASNAGGDSGNSSEVTLKLPAASTTTVSSSLNPSTYGQTVMFTATVISGATGTVTFMDGATTLGTAALDGGGIAAFETSALAGGSHSITAVYDGDANYSGSTSSAITLTVSLGVSSCSVPTSGTYIAGQNLDFTVNYPDNVVVDTTKGTPYIPITIGSKSTNAEYLGGTGTTALTFRYAVQNGDSASGIGVGTSIVSNGGTIKDSAGNSVNLTINNVADTTGIKIDNVAPSCTTTPTNPTYSDETGVVLFKNTAIASKAGNIKNIKLQVCSLQDGSKEFIEIDGTDVCLLDGISGTTENNSYSYAVSVQSDTANVNITKNDWTVEQAQNFIDGLKYKNLINNVTRDFRAIVLVSIENEGGTAGLGTMSGVNIPASSSISLVTASFDKYTSSSGYKDIQLSMTLNGNTLSSIKNGTAELIKNTNYTISTDGSTVTIKKEYFSGLSTGTAKLTFNFNGGKPQNLEISIIDTTQVADNTKPVITLLGISPITLSYGAAYTDAGVTALDNVDGDITSKIVKTVTNSSGTTVSAINTAQAGTYTIHYNVSDVAGNAAVEVRRTVVVQAYVPPYTPPYIPPTPQPTTETRQVPVVVENGNQQTTAVQTTITRTTDTSGVKTDTVKFDEITAAEAVKKASETKTTKAAIDITDTSGNSADRTELELPAASASELANSNMALSLKTEKVALEMPAVTIGKLAGQDVAVKISEEKDSSKIEENKGMILKLVSGAQIIMPPLNIEANITGRVKVTIPIDESKLPTSKGELEEFLSSLAVMVHHSDGEDVVDKGTIVYDEKGNVIGISIYVDKFSSFTLIEIPKDYFLGKTTVMQDKVAADKEWNIKFTKAADAATVTKENVYVTDLNGNKVEVKVSYGSDNVLKVTPVNPYTSGETYYLHISKNVKAKDKTPLVNELRYQFTVK